MRDVPAGFQVLLLRRNSRAGFVPGAYVFAGGRVDASDADSGALARIDGLTAERAARRLGLPDGDPPAIAYYVAAVREAFEETGILVGVESRLGQPRLAQIRDDLLEDRIGFGDALARIDSRIAGDVLEYLAHWITPELEPRRYDARFFAARAPEGAEPIVDAREMTHALWVTPSEGVKGAETGDLPMILPTVQTLRQLAAFGSSVEVLLVLPGLDVPRILPSSDAVPRRR